MLAKYIIVILDNLNIILPYQSQTQTLRKNRLALEALWFETVYQIKSRHLKICEILRKFSHFLRFDKYLLYVKLRIVFR